MNIVVEAAFFCSAFPTALFIWNMLLYREPPSMNSASAPEPVSVLIPARNEERSIAASVESVLASRNIELEIIVLDDGSTDGTAEIVRQLAAQDPRVRLEYAPPLPAGWNGKQHACYALSGHARYNVLCFLDADVRLAPDALTRMSAFLGSSESQFVSGFPFQQTKTFLEWLLLPLIHFILLAYLPLAGMRRFRSSGFAAGCGQFLILRRGAYSATGGHSNIRTTMHDGLLLPQLFRSHGFRTDLADLTDLATCRMYTSARQVWRGLTKNATEGLAAPARILPFTFLLFCGQILPLLLFISFLIAPERYTLAAAILIVLAFAASLLPRLLAVWRYRQPLRSALLHPLGVAVLLALQWYAFARKLCGQQATWKERAYPAG